LKAFPPRLEGAEYGTIATLAIQLNKRKGARDQEV
jgi:hypothetical protein